MTLPYIKVYKDFISIVRELDNGARGRLFLAIMQYANEEEVDNLTGAEKIAFLTVKSQIDRDRDAYTDISEKRKLAGKAGAERRWEQEDMANAILPIANDSKNSKCHQDKDKDKDKDKEDILTVSNETVCQSDLEKIVLTWNEVGVNPVSRVTKTSKRYKNLETRIREYSVDEILSAIEKVRHSSFLKGQNRKGWAITFDWFVLPNNFHKVLEGAYDDRSRRTGDKTSNVFMEIGREEGLFGDER